MPDLTAAEIAANKAKPLSRIEFLNLLGEYAGGFPGSQVVNNPLALHDAAQRAELAKRDEPVKVKFSAAMHTTSAKHDGCQVFSFAGLRPVFCPNCGRRIEWS